MKLRIFQAVAEAINVATGKKSSVALQYEPPNLSANATVQSIQSAIRSAEGGQTRELFALYRDLSAGGSHIQSEFNKRKLAMLAQPMTVLPADKAKPEDSKAVLVVQQAISDCENWMDGITHLLDSSLWPVSVVEKIFRPVQPGEPAAALGMKYTLKRLEPVNMTLLCFQKPIVGTPLVSSVPGALVQADTFEPELKFYSTDEYGRINYNMLQAFPADPQRHLVHRGHLLIGLRDNWGGPMRAIVFWWLLSTLARDWFARSMERYGTPFPVGHTDAKDPVSVKLLADAFSLSTKIGGLVVDHDTQVELKEIALSNMADAHERFINVCNREISKIIVGQTLSAEVQSTGLGSGTSNLQADVREDIRMFDQIKMGDTVRQHLFRQILTINGAAGAPPKPVWGGLSDEDSKTFGDLLNVLKLAGLEPTDKAMPIVNERLGFEVQRVVVAAPAPGPGPGLDGKPNNGFSLQTAAMSPGVRRRFAVLSTQAAMADAMGVPAAWLNPVRDFLDELESKCEDATITEQDLLDFLEGAIKRVPELFKEMDIEELAKVMEAGMGGAVVDQVRNGIRKTATN